MCKSKTYPPRFVVVVNGENATKDVMTRVTFPGSVFVQSKNECCFTVALTCDNRNQKDSSKCYNTYYYGDYIY